MRNLWIVILAVLALGTGCAAGPGDSSSDQEPGTGGLDGLPGDGDGDGDGDGTEPGVGGTGGDSGAGTGAGGTGGEAQGAGGAAQGTGGEPGTGGTGGGPPTWHFTVSNLSMGEYGETPTLTWCVYWQVLTEAKDNYEKGYGEACVSCEAGYVCDGALEIELTDFDVTEYLTAQLYLTEAASGSPSLSTRWDDSFPYSGDPDDLGVDGNNWGLELDYDFSVALK